MEGLSEERMNVGKGRGRNGEREVDRDIGVMGREGSVVERYL